MQTWAPFILSMPLAGPSKSASQLPPSELNPAGNLQYPCFARVSPLSPDSIIVVDGVTIDMWCPHLIEVVKNGRTRWRIYIQWLRGRYGVHVTWVVHPA